MARHKRIYDRKRQLRFKRIRFVIILLLLAIFIVGGIWFFMRRAKTDTPEAGQNTSSTTEQTAAPEVSASPTDAAALATEASPEPTQRPADLLKAVVNNDGIKTAYLTFDDGPTNANTPKILDILRRYNIKATFFQVGSLIADNPDMSRRVYEEGHLIANHSYSHNYSALYKTEEAFMSEFNRTQELITQITEDPEQMKLIRFPGGGYNAGTWGANKQKYKEVLAQNNIYYCDWNALNGDAEGKPKSVQELIDYTKKTVGSHEDVVILMHDAAAKKATVEALPSIIDYLLSQGYECRRLDQ